jgi:hypothetical protein
MSRASSRSCCGVWTTMPLPSPKLSEPQSRVQISEALWVLAGADLQVAAHPGGQVDDDILVALANALDHLAVEMNPTGALAGLGIADMAMDHRGTGRGGLQRRCGDVARLHGDRRMPADGIARPGDGAGDDDLGIHGGFSLLAPWNSPEFRQDRRANFVFCDIG